MVNMSFILPWKFLGKIPWRGVIFIKLHNEIIISMHNSSWMFPGNFSSIFRVLLSQITSAIYFVINFFILFFCDQTNFYKLLFFLWSFQFLLFKKRIFKHHFHIPLKQVELSTTSHRASSFTDLWQFSDNHAP